VTHPLLELQAADTMAEQLRHRRQHLPERDHLQAAKNELVRWDQAVTLRRTRLAELTAEIEADEARSKAIDKHRDRLEKQLKTVIAVREAEALQHELATLAQERSSLDDAELEAMEEQSRLDDELVEFAAQEAALRQTYLDADAAMQAAAADVDGELDRIAARLDTLRSAVEPALLERYDRQRRQHIVAAAGLAGSRCEGCHLDLSASELDRVKADAAKTGVTDCPNCGRLLVVQ